MLRTPLADFFSILLSNRFMNCDKLRPIRERALDLQFGNHLRHAGHDIFLLEERRAIAHEVDTERPSRMPSRIAAVINATASG